jgi:uncharacterized protein involved in outer membrane biogenesis
MMKRIVATLFFLSLALIALALVAPGFVDWSAHKDRLISQLEPYLGRRLVVGGQVKFRLLPNPQILLEDVALENAKGAQQKDFMTLRQLEARIKFQPLLQGRFEVDTINLSDPVINLEILDDGTPDWTGILKERESRIANEAEAIQLNQVSVTGGALHYVNHVTGSEWRVDNLDLAVSADTLFGPYRISGTMQYRGTRVGLEVGTGRFESGETPVPVHMAFTPDGKLPQVKIEGTIDMRGDSAGPGTAASATDAPPPQEELKAGAQAPLLPGPTLRGELSVSDGNLASLAEGPLLHGVAFLNEPTDLGATLLLRGGEARLTDIKAKFGKRGEISGKLGLAFEKGKTPALDAELSGANLVLLAKPGFAPLPEGIALRLKFKGKNLVWGGATLPAAAITTETGAGKWEVKSLRLDLPAKSVIKLAGTATPADQYAAYNVELATEDLAALLKSLPLAQGNALKSLETGVVKKFSLAGSLDLRSDSLSFSNIDAKIDDKVKVSGVLTAVRETKQPSFRASLNFEDADLSIFPDEAWQRFAGELAKADGDLALSVKNLSSGGRAGASFTLNGSTGGGGLQLKDMAGTFADGGDFKLSGKLAALSPAISANLQYALKTHAPGAVAKALGLSLPPPLKGETELDVHGQASGEAKKFTFDAAGTEGGLGFSLQGSSETGEEGVARFHEKLHFDKADGVLAAATGVALDRLLPGTDGLTADLSGARAAYKLDKIAAGPVSGWLSRKEGKLDGELKADTLDAGAWFSGAVPSGGELKLALSANKLLWRGNEFSQPVLTLETGPEHLKISDFKAALWGGTLSGAIEAKRKDGAWNAKFKGSDAGADLAQLQERLDLKGFGLGAGDVDFDLDVALPAEGAGEGKDLLTGAGGTLEVRTGNLTVHHFAPGPLADMLAGLKHEPERLAEQMTAALNSGSATYKDVTGRFKLGHGSLTIDSLKLSSPDADLDVTGALETGPATYHVAAKVQLHEPATLPAFTVNRTGGVRDAPDYTVNAAPVIEYFAKREAKPAPENPAPAPGIAPPIPLTPPGPAAGQTPPTPPPASPGSDKTSPELDKAAPDVNTPAASGMDAPIEEEPLSAPMTDVPPSPGNNPAPLAPANNVPPAPPAPPETPPTVTPAPPPLEKPAPPQIQTPATPAGNDSGAIKGILDRLNDAPPDGQTQKP